MTLTRDGRPIQYNFSLPYTCLVNNTKFPSDKLWKLVDRIVGIPPVGKEHCIEFGMGGGVSCGSAEWSNWVSGDGTVKLLDRFPQLAAKKLEIRVYLNRSDGLAQAAEWLDSAYCQAYGCRRQDDRFGMTLDEWRSLVAAGGQPEDKMLYLLYLWAEDL